MPASTQPGRSRGGPPRRVGDVLEAFLKRSGLHRKMEDHRVFAGWEKVVGPELSRHAKPMKIERGILWIGVDNAPQANQLSYLKPMILERLRESFPESRIRGLKILHRPGRGITN